MITVSPLFSGSKGNSTLIRTEKLNILLDVGYGYKALLEALRQRNLTPADIDAIVITHEHTDHVCALPLWTKKWSTPVYVPSQIVSALLLRAPYASFVGVDGNFILKGVNVEIYPCSHDALCCLGYRFTDCDGSFAYVTDTGCWGQPLVDFLSPCHTVMLESNHDVDMLAGGPYPYTLKRRILSDCGHLSNTQTGLILQRLVGSNVKNVILAHLSEQNNTKEIAFATAVNALANKGCVEGKDVFVYVADQFCNGEVVK